MKIDSHIWAFIGGMLLSLCIVGLLSAVPAQPEKELVQRDAHLNIDAQSLTINVNCIDGIKKGPRLAAGARRTTPGDVDSNPDGGATQAPDGGTHGP